MTKFNVSEFKNYLVRSYGFINKNKKIYFIYLGLFLFEYGIISLNYKSLHIPDFSILLLLLVAFFLSVYNYFLQYYFFNRYKNKKIELKGSFKASLQYAKRLIWPFISAWALFILFIIVLIAVSELSLHIKLTKTIFIQTKYNHGIGFYPARAILVAILEFLCFSFIFSPILFALKGIGFWRSFIESLKLSLKNIPFVAAIGFLVVAFTFLGSLFIPTGNYYLSVAKSVIESYLYLLLGVCAFFYYQDHYPIEEILLNPKKQRAINVNIIYRRIIAAGIDILLWILIFFIGAAILGNGFKKTTDDNIAGNFFLIFFLSQFAYFVLTEWLMSGTLGKKIMRVRVITEKGTRISFIQSVVRNLFRIVDLFPFIIPYLVGLVILAASDKKQRLGDKLAHTIVSR